MPLKGLERFENLDLFPILGLQRNFLKRFWAAVSHSTEPLIVSFGFGIFITYRKSSVISLNGFLFYFNFAKSKDEKSVLF
jgi:hypothetical protein